jgi:hypothetical protein
MRKTSVLAGLAVLFLASSVFAGDNWLGTWKFNAAKSKFNGPAPQVLTWEAAPDGTIKFNSTGTDPQGKPVHTSFVSKFDGKDVPYTGNPNADTASPNRVDANTYENTWKLGGKPTIEAKVVVSADGKSLTVSQKGKDAKGGPVNNTLVFEKH